MADVMADAMAGARSIKLGLALVATSSAFSRYRKGEIASYELVSFSAQYQRGNMKGHRAAKDSIDAEMYKDVDSKKSTSDRTFDKKKYRLKKYSNKYKVLQWEERRKEAILREYYKEIRKDQNAEVQQKSTDSRDTPEPEGEQSQPKKKIGAFHKAKKEYLRRRDEKKRKKEEALRIKAEKEEALKKYKEKKMQTFKKLSKKTKRGQPVMKDRIELLLEKIRQDTFK